MVDLEGSCLAVECDPVNAQTVDVGGEGKAGESGEEACFSKG